MDLPVMMPNGVDYELSPEEMVKLLEAAASGSEQAARQLTEQYGPFLRVAVRRWLHKRLRTKFDSLDFVQDVWASFFSRGLHGDSFNNPAQLIAFLRLMARNKVVTAFRSQMQAKKANLNREHSLQEITERTGQLKDDRQLTPSQIVSSDEEWELFLKKQPPNCREILDRYRSGQNVPTISRDLQISPKTVYHFLKHMLTQLKHDSRFMGREGPGHAS